MERLLRCPECGRDDQLQVIEGDTEIVIRCAGEHTNSRGVFGPKVASYLVVPLPVVGASATVRGGGPEEKGG